ncbi:MAG: hydroxyacylglutathione hydrolase family protein [bacterium]
MKIIQFALDLNYVNVYLTFDEATKDAFLVDCGAFTDDIHGAIKSHGLQLRFLLLTHTHYDHINGISELKKSYPVPIYAAESGYDHQVAEGDTIPFCDETMRVFETPGHTPDGVCYIIRDRVFVGDAIFSGAVGGTASRENFWQQNRAVWDKVLHLPGNTTIYPGHGAPSTVEVERLYNPFFA